VDWFLRARLRIKRELMKTIRYRPYNFETIQRTEKKSQILVEKIAPYSKASTSSILDPRSGRNLGHYFNQRDVFIVKNVILEPRQGVIYSEKGALISESTWWTTSGLYESFPWNPNPKFIVKNINEENLINLTSNSFGHWLTEDLGSILYLIDNFPDSKILVLKNHPKFVSDLIDYLDREIIYVDGPVKVKSILLVTKQNDGGWMHPKDAEILKNFQNKLINPQRNPSKRIYASRRNLPRSPKNEQDIEELFVKFDFSILQLERLNFIEEIKLISEANFLSGGHGSYAHNAVWMNSGSTVFDIVNENYWTELPHRICGLNRINYKSFLYAGNSDSRIDIRKLEIELEQILN